MKIRLLIIAIIALLAFGCKNTNRSKENQDVKILVSHILTKNAIGHDKYIVLYISEGMCSECINKEIINLSNDSVLLKRLIIVGAYSRKRLFCSDVNLIPFFKNIYVPIDNSNKYLLDNKGLFYFTFNGSTKVSANYFYPQPCNKQETLVYFNKVKSYILN